MRLRRRADRWAAALTQAALRTAAALLLALLAHVPAHGQAAPGLLKVSVAGRAALENQVSELGQEQGFFRRHNIVLELRYRESSAETLQDVISGAADAGISVATLPTFAAFAKG